MKRFGLVLDDYAADMSGEPPRKKANLMQKLRRHDADAFAKVLRYVEAEVKSDRRMFGANRIQIPSVLHPSPVIGTPQSVSSPSKSLPLPSPQRPNPLLRPHAPEPATRMSPEIEMTSPDKEEGMQSEMPLVIPASPVAEAEMDTMIDSPFKPKSAIPSVPEAVMQLTPDPMPLPVQPTVQLHQQQRQGPESEHQQMSVLVMPTDDPMATTMMMDVPEHQPQMQNPSQLQHQLNPQPQPQLQTQPGVQPQPQAFPQPAPQAAIQGRRIRRVSRTRRTDEMAQDEPMQTMLTPEPRLSVLSFGSGPTPSDVSSIGNPYAASGFGNPQPHPFQPSPQTSGSGFFGSMTTPSSHFGTPNSLSSFQATPSTFQSQPPSMPSPQQTFGTQFFSSPQKSSFGTHSGQSPPKPNFGGPPTHSPSKPTFGGPPTHSSQLPTFGGQSGHSPPKPTFGGPLADSPQASMFGVHPGHSPQVPVFGGQPTQNSQPSKFGTQSAQSPQRFGTQSFQSPHQPPTFGQHPGQSPPVPNFGQQAMDSTQTMAFGSQQTNFQAPPNQPAAPEQPFMANANVSFSFGRLSTPARRTGRYGRRKARN